MPRRKPREGARFPAKAPLFPEFDQSAEPDAAEALRAIPAPPAPAVPPSGSAVLHGPQIPPQQRILLYSPAEWESFIHEWAHFCLKTRYWKVERFGGAGDRGIDILGFTDKQKLWGVWDNYQCKHYIRPLRPTDAWPEIGKLLWYTYKKEYRAPRGYFFVAPLGVGTALAALLGDAAALKQGLLDNWDKYCRETITETQGIPLEGPLLDHVRLFDFSLFDTKTGLQVIEDHRSCPYHAVRFGGGLPARPPAAKPPPVISPGESHYVSQLYAAYSDHKKMPVPDNTALRAWPTLADHFERQREAFYHAESLRIFARDTVPPGTFESLQDDVHAGVVDVQDADHHDGYVRVCKVTEAARNLNLTENALLGATRPRDRDGICHQLANDDRLRWIKP